VAAKRGASSYAAAYSIFAWTSSAFHEVYARPLFAEAWQQILEHPVWVDSVGYSIFILRFEGGDDEK
jgi:hypothetical protein